MYSSALLASAASNGHDLKAFTIGFPDAEADEEPYARMVWERYKDRGDLTVSHMRVEKLFHGGDSADGVGAIRGVGVGMALSPFPQRRAAGPLALGATIALVTLLSTVGRPYVNFSKRRAGGLAYDAYEAIEAGDYPRAIELLQHSVARDPESSSSNGIRLGPRQDGVAMSVEGAVVEANVPDLMGADARMVDLMVEIE